MTRVEALVEFVERNPGSTISDVMEEFSIDAADAWHRVIDAGRLKMVKAKQDESGKWHLTIPRTP